MIYSLEGSLVDLAPTQAVVAVGGISFLVNVPLSTSEKLGSPGSPAKLFTYLHVREDALELYGFLTIAERKAFELLLGIPGVGQRSPCGSSPVSPRASCRRRSSPRTYRSWSRCPASGRRSPSASSSS